MTSGTNQPDTWSAKRWIGAGPLRLRHHLDDLRKHGIATNASRIHDQSARLIDGPCDELRHPALS